MAAAWAADLTPGFLRGDAQSLLALGARKSNRHGQGLPRTRGPDAGCSVPPGPCRSSGFGRFWWLLLHERCDSQNSDQKQGVDDHHDEATHGDPPEDGGPQRIARRGRQGVAGNEHGEGHQQHKLGEDEHQQHATQHPDDPYNLPNRATFANRGPDVNGRPFVD